MTSPYCKDPTCHRYHAGATLRCGECIFGESDKITLGTRQDKNNDLAVYTTDPEAKKGWVSDFKNECVYNWERISDGSLDFGMDLKVMAKNLDNMGSYQIGRIIRDYVENNDDG